MDIAFLGAGSFGSVIKILIPDGVFYALKMPKPVKEARDEINKEINEWLNILSNEQVPTTGEQRINWNNPGLASYEGSTLPVLYSSVAQYGELKQFLLALLSSSKSIDKTILEVFHKNPEAFIDRIIQKAQLSLQEFHKLGLIHNDIAPRIFLIHTIKILKDELVDVELWISDLGKAFEHDPSKPIFHPNADPTRPILEQKSLAVLQLDTTATLDGRFSLLTDVFGFKTFILSTLSLVLGLEESALLKTPSQFTLLNLQTTDPQEIYNFIYDDDNKAKIPSKENIYIRAGDKLFFKGSYGLPKEVPLSIVALGNFDDLIKQKKPLENSKIRLILFDELKKISEFILENAIIVGNFKEKDLIEHKISSHCRNYKLTETNTNQILMSPIDIFKWGIAYFETKLTEYMQDTLKKASVNETNEVLINRRKVAYACFFILNKYKDFLIITLILLCH